MPTLLIKSLYQKNRRQYASELAEARAERDRFLANLVARFGKEEATVIRVYLHPGEAVRFGKIHGLPDLSGEALAAVDELETLHRNVVAVWRKIHAGCWFRESFSLVSVLDAMKMWWGNVNLRCKDGRLPISGVLWLLKILRAHEEAMREGRDEPDRRPDGCQVSKMCQRRLHNGRCRLAMLLRMAAMLEEDVQWKFHA